MLAMKRGPDNVTVFWKWPDEANPANDAGQPGDFWYGATADGAGIIQCGPKSRPIAGANWGVWPTPVTLGAAGAAGPASPALTDRGVYAPTNVAYAVNDVVTYAGQRHLRPVAGSGGTSFNPAQWIPLGRVSNPVIPVNGDYIGPRYNSIAANTFLPSVGAGFGLLTWIPFYAPIGGKFNGFNFTVGTAQVGGATSFTAAIFGDAGIDGMTPDWASGPVASSAASATPFNLLTLGGQTALLASPLPWSPGALYYLATLYLETTVPTSRARVTMTSGAPLDYPLPASAGGALTKGFTVTDARTGWPTTNPGPTGVRENGTTIAAVAIRASN